MLSDVEWAQVQRKLRITPRELQVLRCVFDEHTDASIARVLGISQSTVRAHLEKLFRKCNCRTRTGAVVSVFQTYVEKMTT